MRGPVLPGRGWRWQVPATDTLMTSSVACATVAAVEHPVTKQRASRPNSGYLGGGITMGAGAGAGAPPFGRSYVVSLVSLFQ